MKTFNRGKLRKLVEAGRVEMIHGYSFDDMYGETRTDKIMPVAMKPDDWKDRKEGICYLTEWDFKTKSGTAYVRGPNENDVTLIVHSNNSYELRIKPANG